MIDFIVFTKDRPAQYDLLVRSLMPWVAEGHSVRTVYKRTSDRMHRAYRQTVGALYLQEETTFKDTLLNMLYLTHGEHVCMLADDNVFLGRPTNEELEFLTWNHCASLRLHTGINYCQPAGKKITPPRFVVFSHGYQWAMSETERHLCLGYPQAIENIHKRAQLHGFIKHLGVCRNSGDLEVAMGGMYAQATHMVCLRKPYIINIPWNRVLNTNNPTVQGFTVDEALERFESGQRLSLDHVLNQPLQNACHAEIEPVWE